MTLSGHGALLITPGTGKLEIYRPDTPDPKDERFTVQIQQEVG